MCETHVLVRIVLIASHIPGITLRADTHDLGNLKMQCESQNPKISSFHIPAEMSGPTDEVRLIAVEKILDVGC